MAIPKTARPAKGSLDNRANKVRVEFLKIDSEIGLTFSGIALGAMDEDKKKRTTRTARDAYDAIMRLRNYARLTDAETKMLDANLHRLKDELQQLGETF